MSDSQVKHETMRRPLCLTIACNVITHDWDDWNYLEEPGFVFQRCVDCGILRVLGYDEMKAMGMDR